MALFKEIKQPDGVITDYHRILFLQTTVNQQNSIAVLSYVSSEVRDGERKITPIAHTCGVRLTKLITIQI